MSQPRSGPTEQMTMFAPPRKLPRWRAVPATAREDVLRLLAQMIRGYLQAGAATPTGKRCTDD